MTFFRTGEYVGEMKRTGLERIGGRFQESDAGVGWCSSGLVGGKEWLWLALAGLV